MGLGKFMASRIHQRRAQKSYLAAHPSWSSIDEPRYSPRCGEVEEPFSPPYSAASQPPTTGITSFKAFLTWALTLPSGLIKNFS